MRQQASGNGEVPFQQALDQIEVAGEMFGDRRINAAGDRQDRKQHVEQQNEQQAPNEVRDRKGHGDDAIDKPFWAGMAKSGA
jgi:hypothetical protein